jgi:hypothetical protein
MHPYESHTYIFVVAAEAQQDHQTRQAESKRQEQGHGCELGRAAGKAKKSAEQEVLEKVKRAETRKRRNE